MSDFSSESRVYVDESGTDPGIGFRRKGWSPRGVTLEKIAPFRREQRYQILSAYDQDDIVYYRIFQESTDAAFFLDFIEQLLLYCNRFLENVLC